jgi:hypothetical protein
VELRRSWQRVLGLWTDRPRREGTTIAERYTIQELLGMGSYGLTYLCTDDQNGREVALKESKPSKGRLSAPVGAGGGRDETSASSGDP